MTDAKTEVLGLLTYPIGHSLSPLLRDMLATVCGESVAYLPFEVKNPEEFGAAICGAHAFNVAGFNVTVPYKEIMILHLCGLSEEVGLVGTVSTLIRTEEGYIGHNTDITDMATILARRNLRIENAHILLLGADDAARNAAVLATTGGTAELVILNQSTARAEALAKTVWDINPFLTMWTVAPGHRRELPGSDYLCVQYTSVGMWPNMEETVVEGPRSSGRLSAATDVVYTLEETKFLRLARATGKSVAGNLTMLISQDVHAFSLWTGKWCMAKQEEKLLAPAKGAFPAQGKAEESLRKVLAYRRIQQTTWE